MEDLYHVIAIIIDPESIPAHMSVAENVNPDPSRGILSVGPVAFAGRGIACTNIAKIGLSLNSLNVYPVKNVVLSLKMGFAPVRLTACISYIPALLVLYSMIMLFDRSRANHLSVAAVSLLYSALLGQPCCITPLNSVVSEISIVYPNVFPFQLVPNPDSMRSVPENTSV